MWHLRGRGPEYDGKKPVTIWLDNITISKLTSLQEVFRRDFGEKADPNSLINEGLDLLSQYIKHFRAEGWNLRDLIDRD